MPTEICHYPPLNISTDPHYSKPDMSVVHDIYDRTGFPLTPEGVGVSTVFLRGSTAAYLAEGGEVSFRHEVSDMDFVAVTKKSTRPIGMGYLATALSVDTVTSKRDIQVLYVTEDKLHHDLTLPYRSYLQTKFAPSAWPVMEESRYKSFRAEALSTLIVRGATRKGTNLVTPSGAAQLILEERLYSEPWRLLSLRSYFVTSPNHMREREQLYAAAKESLDLLVRSDRACHFEENVIRLKEDVFTVKLEAKHRVSPRVERILTIIYFDIDQLSSVFGMNKPLSFRTIQGIFVKGKTLLSNPFLRYDADLIFD